MSNDYQKFKCYCEIATRFSKQSYIHLGFYSGYKRILATPFGDFAMNLYYDLMVVLLFCPPVFCRQWLGHNESETLQNRKRQERFARFPHLLTKPSKIRRLSTSENLLIHYRDSGNFFHTICFLCKYISKRKSIYKVQLSLLKI